MVGQQPHHALLADDQDWEQPLQLLQQHLGNRKKHSQQFTLTLGQLATASDAATSP
jgi:hypothetical protein